MVKKQPLIVTGLSGLMGSRFQELYQHQFSFENIDLSAGIDITDKNAIEKAILPSKAQAILHLAAFTDVSKAHEQYSDTNGLCYQINVVGTQNIADIAKITGKHLIHVSTDFIFDGTKQTPYTEMDEPNPIEWYGHTKYLAEKIVQDSLSNFTIIRLASPYGIKPARPDFVASIVDALKQDKLHPQFTDRIITPTFIDDLCKVFNHSILHEPQGIYHAVGSSWHSNYEIANMIMKAYKLQGEVKKGNLEHYLETAPRPYQKTLKISNAKLVKDFQITPLTFEQGLRQITSE